MKVEISAAATDEKLLNRIALSFVRQLCGGRRLGAFDGKLKTILLPFQSHNLAEKNGEILPKLKGERKNERQEKHD